MSRGGARSTRKGLSRPAAHLSCSSAAVRRRRRASRHPHRIARQSKRRVSLPGADVQAGGSRKRTHPRRLRHLHPRLVIQVSKKRSAGGSVSTQWKRATGSDKARHPSWTQRRRAPHSRGRRGAPGYNAHAPTPRATLPQQPTRTDNTPLYYQCQINHRCQHRHVKMLRATLKLKRLLKMF